MELFRAKTKVPFDEREVIVHEVSVGSFLRYLNGEYKSEEDFILDNTDLSEEEKQSLSIDAYNKIATAFFELNKKHFEAKGEKADKKNN